MLSVQTPACSAVGWRMGARPQRLTLSTLAVRVPFMMNVLSGARLLFFQFIILSHRIFIILQMTENLNYESLNKPGVCKAPEVDSTSQDKAPLSPSQRHSGQRSPCVQDSRAPPGITPASRWEGQVGTRPQGAAARQPHWPRTECSAPAAPRGPSAATPALRPLWPLRREQGGCRGYERQRGPGGAGLLSPWGPSQEH